ncbi:hypothetical protein P3T27_007907 [Kitasatospora sp. MAA19]|uniref:hypothetical protein n=1 Tax=Kitasatospora sp. MAA19 TaxID=3035090 RepID=UPI002474CBD3|nr:hypothetical protein [Kitasatospora sp. MAA19]MDH6711155.1 hypothetical protein [Kitasatospora sp. MAA19]
MNVGPLRFGMSHQQTVAAMEARGVTSPTLQAEPRHGVLTQRADFRAPTAPAWLPAVTLSYREPGILACVAVDALQGPQVWLDTLRLVGQVPSELAERVFDYVAEHGMSPAVSTEGDAVSDEPGFMLRAQRAGDVLLTRAFLVAPFDDWAGTMHDCLPSSEWNVR